MLIIQNLRAAVSTATDIIQDTVATAKLAAAKRLDPTNAIAKDAIQAAYQNGYQTGVHAGVALERNKAKPQPVSNGINPNLYFGCAAIVTVCLVYQQLFSSNHCECSK